MKKIVFLLIAIAVCSCYFGCKSKPDSSCLSNDRTKKPVPVYDTLIINPKDHKRLVPVHGSLIIWPKDTATAGGVEAFLDEIRKLGKIDSIYRCASCDSELMLLSGPGPNTYASQQAAKSPPPGGTPNPSGGNGPSGEDGSVWYSLNFQMGSLENRDTASKYSPPQPFPPAAFTGDSIVAGVLDTGTDPDIIMGYTSNPGPGKICIPNGTRGWNFTNGTNIVTDDYRPNAITAKHGNPVSKEIIWEVVDCHNNPINLLPVKVIDSSGSGHLFDVLCGLAYAKRSGAKVINLSLGFYAYDTNHVSFFKKYLKDEFTSKGILIVAAAGNQLLNGEEDSAKKAGISAAQMRDLYFHRFYPASFAKDLGNVIAVTTISPKSIPPPSVVSKFQNYSDSIVDIGVYADKANGDIYYFNEWKSADTHVGSSFAAPVIAGKLCANYNKLNLVPNMPINKEALIQQMKTLNLIDKNDDLLRFIKGGFTAKVGN